MPSSCCFMLGSRAHDQFDYVRHVDFLVLLDEVVAASLAVRGKAIPKTPEEMPGNSPARGPRRSTFPRRIRDSYTLDGPKTPIFAPENWQYSLENRRDTRDQARNPMKSLKMPFGDKESDIRSDIMRIAL